MLPSQWVSSVLMERKSLRVLKRKKKLREEKKFGVYPNGVIISVLLNTQWIEDGMRCEGKKTRPKQSSDWIIIMEPVNLLGKSEQNWIQSIRGKIFRPFTCNSSTSHHPNINWSLSPTNNNNNASRCIGGDDIKMRRKNTHTHTHTHKDTINQSFSMRFFAPPTNVARAKLLYHVLRPFAPALCASICFHE